MRVEKGLDEEVSEALVARVAELFDAECHGEVSMGGLRGVGA